MYVFKFLLPLTFFYALSLQAQEKFVLKGQVLDSVSQTPIPFAHIRLRESISISNQHGTFTLNYNASDYNAEVIISCIGYKTRNIAIITLLQLTKVTLLPDITILGEVVISELEPQTIFEKAKKKGYKNYRTPKYSANYTFNQWVFYDNADSLIAVSKESGVLINKGLDTTRASPKFGQLTKEMSASFLKYDTVSNSFTFLSKQRNTVSLDMLFSFDPVRIGILEQFHAVPSIFSKGFYANTVQQILSIVNIDGKEYYLIIVYPKIEDYKNATSTLIHESKKITEYKEKIKELAKQQGRSLSESTLDSIFSIRGKNERKQSSYVMGFFLINADNFGISHALIKMNTFNKLGELHYKLHVAASYIEIDKSYYLQNMDVLMRRTHPLDYQGKKVLYYFVSLNVANFKIKNRSRILTEKPQIVITESISTELQSQFKLDNIRQFIIPIRDCTDCKINPLKYFNRSF